MGSLFDWIIGFGLAVIGILILIVKFSRTDKHDNEFGKAAHYQYIIIGIFLIIGGIIYLIKI
ncbi:hypothetical protein GCM10027284_30360 [Cyclobacterium sediminis]